MTLLEAITLICAAAMCLLMVAAAYYAKEHESCKPKR